MPTIPRPILAAIRTRISHLRYPSLTAIAAGLFLLDLVIPDVIPLADEILLAIVTAALASWKSERPRATEHAGPVTPTPALQQ